MLRALVCVSLFNNIDSLNPKPTATLYSSSGCRACTQFNKKFNSLQTDYNGIFFRKINISESDENKKMAYEDKIKKIPLMVFKVGDEEKNRIVGTKTHYEEIDETCKGLNTDTSDKNNKNNKNTNTNKNTLDTIVLECAKLCENVYDDEFLKNSEYYVENEDSDCQAVIKKSGSTLFVCFRGSDSLQDWRMNFKQLLVSYPTNSGKKVHAGFLIQWLSVKDELLGKLGKLIDKYRYVDEVVFCGHSAGVVCCLAASDFGKQNKLKKLKCEVVTFGSPRICNKEFKEDFKSRVKCTRIVLDRDLITRLPFRFLGYRHLGTPYQLRENEVINRETSAIETVWWMLLGIVKGDVGIRDHFIDNYVRAIENNLND